MRFKYFIKNKAYKVLRKVLGPDKEEKILTKYQYLFNVDKNESVKLFGLECNSGWFGLIDKMLEEITSNDIDKKIRILQIKEKFGELTVYLNDYSNKKINYIIDKYSGYSLEICEVCSRPGIIRDDQYWIVVLCDKHNKKLIESNREYKENIMKKFLVKLTKKFMISMVKKRMEDDDIKNSIVDSINEKLDIPKLTEKEEEKLLRQIYEITKDNAILILDRL